MTERVKILVVGQTPPPDHGQSIMIAAMLAGTYSGVELQHIRMEFSEAIDEVGRIRPRKLLHMVKLIGAILSTRFRNRPQVLYYPPAGRNRVPVYRDIVVLLATRWSFPHTVFHFHAGGLSEIRPELSAVGRWCFDRAYGAPDVAITLSELNPPDGERIGAKRIHIVPYGIVDNSRGHARPAWGNGALPPRMLFVGAIRESKGVLVLIEALALLDQRGVPFDAQLVGAFHRKEFEAEVRALIADRGLAEKISLAGALTGDPKWRAYAEAQVFCFPTFYEAETFGVVLLEAMQFGLPVVATRWRGVPSIVLDGVTGFLVETHQSAELADRLEQLLRDPNLRASLGAAARERYLAEYTSEVWQRRMERALLDAAR